MSESEPDRYRIKSLRIPTRYPSPGSAVMVGKVVSPASVIAVGKFLLVNPVSVFGTETEGASADTTSDTSTTVPVYLIGPGLPKTGDMLICRFVDFRWAAEKANVNLPNPCGTTWPRLLSYKGSVNQAYAGFYFANFPLSIPEPVYTLTYTTRPTDIPRVLQLEYFNQPGGVFPPYYITMPDSAWFSPRIPILLFGSPSFCYFYLWMNHCTANVMVIDAPYGAYGPYGSGTEGAGNNLKTYIAPTHQFGDNPPLPTGADFGMEPGPFNGPIVIWGKHGKDDVVPDSKGAAGYPGQVTGS